MNRKIANVLRSLMDDWLPPVMRERWPFTWLIRLWLGPQCLLDFKYRAFAMSDLEYAQAYKAIGGLYRQRQADTTDKQIQWLLSNIGSGQRLLEIGPGNRKLAHRLIQLQYNLTTLDLGVPDCSPCNGAVVSVAEKLPFRYKSFDTVIISMVLEHVRWLTCAFLELERVTRDRVLIITPRQRFYRMTFDYHLHFFYSLEHLASHIPVGTAQGQVIDGDLCLIWCIGAQT